MGEKSQQVRWFKSQGLAGIPKDAADIDFENGVIRNVIMVQEGPAKGHGVNLEAEFIDAITEYDQKHFSERGLKARFGHPGASSETMGTQLGYFKNFRKRKNDQGKMEEYADLHLLEAADESPTHKGMRSWVLKMAQDNPDFIMSSIVFRGGDYYQRSSTGEKHILHYDWEDGWLNYKEEYGDIFIEFGEHYYTDLVEAGAATDTLYSNKVNPHLFVAQADQFLEDHPDLKNFIVSNPDKVIAFLGSIGVPLSHKTKPVNKMAFNLMDWLLGKQPDNAINTEEALSVVRTELTALKDDINQLRKEKEDAIGQAVKFEEENFSLNSAVAELESKLSAAQAKITELEKQPADTHTGAHTALGGGESRMPVWEAFKKANGLT
jgi:hypothetical protein